MKLREKISHIGIGTRLVILTGFAIATIIVIFFAVSSMVQRRQALEIFKTHADSLGRTIEHIVQRSMAIHKHQEIYSLLGKIALADALDISLTSHAGVVTFTSKDRIKMGIVDLPDYRCAGCHITPEGKPLRVLPTEKRFQYHPEKGLGRLLRPIYSNPACTSCHSPQEQILGIIEITIPTAYIQETFQRSHYTLMFYLVLMTTLVLFIIMYCTHRWIRKPVRKLIERTKKIAEGDLDSSLMMSAELGDLAQAFNTMQEKLKASRNQLIRSERLASIGKLAAGVAHEINNPLTGILTFTEALIEDSNQDDEKREDYEVIKEETLRCRKIVKNLLDFSRQTKSKLTCTDINDIIQRCVNMLRRQALFSKINIVFKPQESIPRIFVDPGQMQQVFWNLLVNAGEAMPCGGTITITSEFKNKENEVEILVHDTGTGIPEEILTRIFEPFFSTKGPKGNGLGLPVIWGIIEQHGGKCDVFSAVGVGTEFQINLPVNKQCTESAPENDSAKVDNCWQVMNCAVYENCPAYPDKGKMCWQVPKGLCRESEDLRKDFLDKMEVCKDCEYYIYRKSQNSK